MKGKKAIIALFIIFLVFLIICPLLSIFAEAVFQEGRFSLESAIETITESENAAMIGSSLLLGLLVVIVSSIIALPLAYLFSRTQLARYRFFDIIFMIPFMTPPYIASMGWILFMQKRGLMQQLFPSLAFITDWFFSLGGLVMVMSFHVFPFMMTMMKNAMLSVPSSLDEAGAVLGAPFRTRIRKLFMPLITGNYAIGALLVFVKTISEYGTPSTLGRRIGFDVFTTDIHRYATVAPIEFGKSASLASVLIGICLLIWFLQNYITMRKTYSLVGGKGSAMRLVHLSRPALAAAIAFIAAVVFLSMVIPLFSVTVSSLIKLRGYGMRAGNYTFGNYIKVFTEDKQGISALLVSVFLAVSSATIAAMLGTISVTLSSAAGDAAEHRSRTWDNALLQCNLSGDTYLRNTRHHGAELCDPLSPIHRAVRDLSILADQPEPCSCWTDIGRNTGICFRAYHASVDLARNPLRVDDDIHHRIPRACDTITHSANEYAHSLHVHQQAVRAGKRRKGHGNGRHLHSLQHSIAADTQ